MQSAILAECVTFTVNISMDILDLEERKDKKLRNHGAVAQQPELVQILVTIGLVFGLMLLVQSVTEQLISGYYHLSTNIILEDVNGFMAEFGHDLNVFRLAQMINTVVVFGGAALLMSYLLTGKNFGFFKFNVSVQWMSLVLVPFMMVSILPIAMTMQYFVSFIPFPEKWLEMQDTMEALQKGMLGDPSLSVFAVNLIMIAVLPAIFEELLFRGILQPLFVKVTGIPTLGIMVTGFVFGLIHMQVINLLPIAILGVLLGLIYYWTQNIWFPIAAHFIFNGMQAVGYFMATRSEQFDRMESIELLPVSYTLGAIAIFAATTYFFYSSNRTLADG
ncbi:MAG: CPBP family intramembrane metalloprotease [Bacteroidetes bacterium]|nr:CPBP family intramembrane metalloprotease [Bacteroidota bacterium]